MQIGDIVQQHLEKNNLSQRQFAKKCGVSHGYISMLINGKNPCTGKKIVPTLTALQSLSTGLGVTLDSLLRMMDGERVDISPENNRSIVSAYLTHHERTVIQAYRDQPAMQPAVDRILGVEEDLAIDLAEDMAEALAEGDQMAQVLSAKKRIPSSK